jgi:hypothetical protein
MGNGSPWYNYPQPGFAGGPPRPVMGRISAEEAAAMAGLDVKQAIDWVQYDSKYFKSGTAVNASDIIFFSVPINGIDYLGNDSTVSFTKTEMATNMVQGGQLQRGNLLIVESLQAQITIPGNLDATLQASGNTTLPNSTGTAVGATTTTAGVLLGNLYSAIAKSGVISLKVGNKFFERGPLEQFPSEFGGSGFNSLVQAGTSVATSIPVNDGIINNGFGFARNFRIPRQIVAGQNFGVYLNFYNLFTPARNFDVTICLKGLLFEDVS